MVDLEQVDGAIDPAEVGGRGIGTDAHDTVLEAVPEQGRVHDVSYCFTCSDSGAGDGASISSISRDQI